MTSLATAARRVVWSSWGILLLQQISDLWLRQAPWVICLAILLPLLIFLPGMLRDRLRSYIWLCFICLLYFMRLVVRLFEQPESWLAITGTVAVVLLFTSAMMYVRWRARELRTADQPGTGSGE